MRQLGVLEWLLLACAVVVAISFLVGRMKVYQDRLLTEIREHVKGLKLRHQAAAQVQEQRERRRKRLEDEHMERELRKRRMLARERAVELEEQTGGDASVSAPSGRLAD